MDDELKIVFKVEGLDSEGGHVRLDHLLKQLELLKKGLEQIDSIVDDEGKPAAYYRVVAASHSSPLTMTLEPVPRETRKEKPTRERLIRGHDRFFTEINSLRSGTPPSADVDNETLQTLQKLVSLQGRTYKTASVYNHTASVQLDVVLKQKVDFFLHVEDQSYGTISGRLDQLNLHAGTNAFWIYPAAGPKRILCKFLPGDKAKVKNALEKTVEVTGTKYYRPNSDFPHRIEVASFEEIPFISSKAILSIKEPGEFSKHDSVTEINELRDEW